jgi:hypothetical protein
MNKAMLKEITAVCAKYPYTSGTSMFLMLYDEAAESFTGTCVYGKLLKEEYDVRSDM